MNTNQNNQQQPDSQIDTLEDKLHNLIVFNDDFNTFDFVIEQLISICGHTYPQAYQCTIQIHYKGKSVVKKGSTEKLSPLLSALLSKGLTAKID